MTVDQACSAASSEAIVRAGQCWRRTDDDKGIPMRRDVWIFLFVLGALFFSWPIMSIFENSLVISLFIIWLLFIVCIFITSIFSEREDGGG
jgi:hypothetical protein